MMIQIPQAVQEEKGLLLLMILDILAEETDAAHHMKKGRLRERIEERYGFKPSRNTLYGKLEIMRLAGISVVQEEDGLYYDADHLTDGELRYLVDSVLYSDFVTPKGAEGIIESLAKLGSPIFRKYVERQKARIKHTRKNKQQGIFATIEDVQSAIFRRHQLRFNEVYYDRDLKPKRKHQTYLTVNPYEMVCKNGRYYLIGAEEGAEEMRTWRLDRICDVAVLETPRVEIRQYLDVMASGGMSIYADAQPELCGGTIENFKLQVSDMAVDEIVDVFGTDFKILHDGKTGPDVIRISVRTTRESVRSWALIHASKVVILEPLDLRDEIKDQLWHSAQQYQIANRSVRLRSRYADTLQEAVRMAKLSGQTELTYNSRRRGRHPYDPEKIDTTLFEGMEQIEWLRLSRCEITDNTFLSRFPNLRILHLNDCRYDRAALRYAPDLTELSVSFRNPGDEQVLAELKHLKKLSLGNISDCSVLTKLPELESLELIFCDQVSDFSCLAQIPTLKRLIIFGTDEQKDFDFLKTMTQLELLGVESKHFNFKDAMALQEKLPNCRIETHDYDDDF